MRFFKLAGIGAMTMLLMAACGGSTTTPTVGPKTSGPAAATLAPASVSSAASATPAAPLTTAAQTSATGGGGADVCALLSPLDLKTATGKTYLAGTIDAAGQCEWDTSASGANSGDLIIVAVQPQSLSFVQSAFSSGGVSLTIAGHPAFWNPTQGLGSLWVDAGGGNLLIISLPRSSDLTASDQAVAQALAQVAVSHM